MISRGAPTYVLPGTWSRIDLTSPEAMKKSVRAMVDHQVGRSDQLAQLRADLRAQTVSIGERARERGAIEYQFAHEIVPGVPFGATVALYLPDVDMSQAQTLGPGDLTRLLDDVITGQSADVDEATFVDTEDIRAVRHVYEKTVTTENSSEPLDVLDVDYWISASYPPAIALMNFSTIFVQQRDLVLELFDAIVGTVRWPRVRENTIGVAALDG